MTILIRSAQTSDRAEITRLHIAVGADTYRGIMTDHYLDVVRPADKRKLWIDRMKDGIDSASYSVMVAAKGSELVGFIFFDLIADQEFGTYLHHIYIASSHQGRQLGQRLLVEGINSLPHPRGAEPLHLVALKANTRATAFYHALDGRVIEETSRPQAGGPDVELCRFYWDSADALASAARAKLEIHAAQTNQNA